MTDGISTAKKPVSRFSAGLRFHQMGDLSQAEECYRETLQVEPDHPDALHLLGVAALQLGRVEESMQVIRRAIELQPDTAEYHNSLASAYKELGRIEDAMTHYRRCVELKPDYAVAHHNLGNVFSETHREQEALEHFRRAQDLSPDPQPRRPPAAAETGPVRTPLDSLPAFSRVDAAASGPGITSGAKETAQKTVLHVGCGPRNSAGLHERFCGPEWREVRLDIDPGVQPDVVASLTDMSEIGSDSADALFSSHNLEHLYGHEVPLALAEFLRVLKPGGLVLVTMPDLQQLAHHIIADKLDDVLYVSPAGPITTLDCLFGFGKAIAQGNAFMAHKTGFTERSLCRRLQDAGFVDARTWTNPFSLWAEAYKPRA
ncbi:MAG: tetratricopeptide repeat protein [Planctomycetaceae bacterium]